MKTHFVPLLLATCLPASASVLMLDFGPDSVAAGQVTNSPYHTVNPGFTGTTWNSNGVADVNSGLLYADGTAATGVAYNLGFGNNTTVIDLATNPTSANGLGTVQNSGPYATGAPGRDAIYEGSGSAVRHTGLQVTGLAAGIYEVFVVTRNTNTSNTYTMTAHIGVGLANANFDFTSAGYASQGLSYTGSGQSTAWVPEGSVGENYTRFVVTVGAGQAINIAVQGDNTQTRGFLNLVQIVAIPEPSAAALATIGLLPVFRRRRRIA